MNKEKIRKERIFEVVHCPFEGWAKLHHLCQPNGQVGWCYIGDNWKGQGTISNILFPLLLYTFIEQKLFFPETCFAYPISEQKFTMWSVIVPLKHIFLSTVYLHQWLRRHAFIDYYCHDCICHLFQREWWFFPSAPIVFCPATYLLYSIPPPIFREKWLSGDLRYSQVYCTFEWFILKYF